MVDIRAIVFAWDHVHAQGGIDAAPHRGATRDRSARPVAGAWACAHTAPTDQARCVNLLHAHLTEVAAVAPPLALPEG
jgi:hypothetical protein